MTDTPRKTIHTYKHIRQQPSGLNPDCINYESCNAAIKFITDNHLELAQSPNGFYLRTLAPNGPERTTADSYRDALSTYLSGNSLHHFAEAANGLASALDSDEMYPIQGFSTLTRMQTIARIQLGTIKEGPRRG